jgi:hypothetical protein
MRYAFMLSRMEGRQHPDHTPHAGYHIDDRSSDAHRWLIRLRSDGAPRLRLFRRQNTIVEIQQYCVGDSCLRFLNEAVTVA